MKSKPMKKLKIHRI